MTHTCAVHEPGAPACYFRCSCRCDACGTAGRAQDKRNRVRRQLTGQAAGSVEDDFLYPARQILPRRVESEIIGFAEAFEHLHIIR